MEDGHSNQSHWIPLADLMTGLMMIFMLLTASFMLRVEQTTTLVVQEYEQTKDNMRQALQEEFREDLKLWNAEMLGDMTIRFKDPSALFATGSSTLRPQFKNTLAEFFPRYVRLITSDQYRDAVKEVRIEGHTSAFWSQGTDATTAYFRNMELSQARTRTTLEFLLTLDAITGHRDWLIRHVTANGLSSSRPVSSETASLQEQLSDQRVEIRIVTNASERMDEIAKELAQQ